MRRAFEVVALLLKCYYNSQKFLIIGLITCLGQNQFPRLESHQTLLTIFLKLRKYRCNCIFGRVRLYTYVQARIEVCKDCYIAKDSLQPREGLLGYSTLLPLILRHLVTIAFIQDVSHFAIMSQHIVPRALYGRAAYVIALARHTTYSRLAFFTLFIQISQRTEICYAFTTLLGCISRYAFASLQQVGQRAYYIRIAFDKPTIKIHKSKENLYVIDAFKPWLICNRLNPLRVYTDALLAYNKAQEVYF